MSYWEKIRDIMQKDPSRMWSAAQLAKVIEPDAPAWRRYSVRSNVANALKRAEKYGLVQIVGLIKEKNHNMANGWMLA